MGQVVEDGHLGAGARCRWEAEARAGHAFDRRLDAIDLVELLLSALGLGAAGGTGPEAIDVGLLGRDLLLLAFKGGLGGLPFHRLLFEMGGVVAQIAAGNAAFRGDDLVADAVEEGAVVTDDHQSCRLLQQVALQPLDGLDVEVVGRFVEQQQIGILEQDLAEGDPHLPAAGVVADLAFSRLRAEADRWQQLVDARVELVAVQRFKATLQTAQVLDQSIEMVGIGGRLFGAHRLFHRPLLIENEGGFTEGLEQLFANAALGVDVEFLLQVGDARFPLTHHLATGGLLLSSNQPQLGGFASAVDAHEADAITGLHLPGDVTQDLAGGVNLADALESQHRCRARTHHHPCRQVSWCWKPAD